MERIEKLRSLLYTAIDNDKKDEILRLSKEIDKIIVKEMREIALIKL